uniref:NADH dehydrogenase [ubiquinone] 1 alpha subcomplex subunit 12 n=1 Tax=Dunaliella tertiolecta TaxID=3047 RepID=A0A7S3QL95_DUNTE|mmetsp:Transcript_78/g.155  ORF Transcript_78/g.155 Transcript_78/m.155 type:complete len:158 (+) Transcript_78:38-511(+)|eukprot:CAMPEP_0202355192 /NCGR_PEP_ID=MMETSP1126-20121109/10196_1 /ASSEMBLY_ACC=CAM_ASM_000457 /TAXON_ID=3047 /ORGANISM="Dunaliella tertiolecta, Strain CCMP1320" /LENGTH=157 /DNA_ID=CAMNT_0048947781 /DNA_START=38 /DNA_END=511 /DNA_ORIENTATION=-
MSLRQHLAKVIEGNEVKDLKGFAKWMLSWEGVKMLGDGNIGFIKLIKGPTAGTLVGQDQHGNKYYENNNLQYDRKRWVMYKDTFDYSPSTIPPEWHGWINYVNDYTPHNHNFGKPIYALPTEKTKTGTDGAYQPKGTWTTQKKRNWVKYSAWQPPQA